MPFVTPALHHTSRGLRAALVVCAIATLVPLIHGELLPFTNAALFTDAQPFFTDYSLRDAEGKPLDPHDFGLGPVYYGLRGDSVRHPGRPPGAMQRPASRNRWGETLDEEAVRSLVAKGMRQHGIRGPVFVRQRIMGAMDDERVGVVAERHVQVMPATPAAP